MKRYDDISISNLFTVLRCNILCLVILAYEDISEEEPDETQADVNLLSNSKSSTATEQRRESGPGSGCPGGGHESLFCSPLRIETSAVLGAASGPASAPCLAPGWPHSPFLAAPLASPAPSLPLSPSVPLAGLQHHLFPMFFPLAPVLPGPPHILHTSSTPLASSKLPFSISNILGKKETETKEAEVSKFDILDKPQYLHSSYSQSLTFTDDSGYDSSKLCNSQVEADETEDSYIDVVGLDDEEEDDKTVTKESLNPNRNLSQVVQSGTGEGEKDCDATNIVSEPFSDTRDNVQTHQEIEESKEHVFDIKKKMFDNWSKSKQSQDLKEALCEEAKSAGIAEYRHKKIRRTSHENQELQHELEDNGGVKKKTFVLDKYELNTNINKNKRKEEKWSQSETDSPDKKKDQHKMKKKHKSYKEERWKISKTIKSPVRFPPSSSAPVPDPDPSPRSCSLGEADLIEGLRLLLRVGAHFYAGRLSEISPPDIYGIIIDKERGSKPHIFSRQEIVRDAVSHHEFVSKLSLCHKIYFISPFSRKARDCVFLYLLFMTCLIIVIIIPASVDS